MGIRWDDNKNSFVSTETGLKLSPARVMSMLNQTIEAGHKKLQDLADAVFNGDISLVSFADQMADTLKQMHLAEALKVKNGVDALTPNNIKLISNILRDELVTGIGVDENGDKHPFGIINLINDINSNSVSLVQLKNRLGMFGENARKSAEATRFSDSEDDPEITECLNILNKVKTSHHPICIEVTAKGWMPLAEMKKVGLPARHALCHCHLIFR